MKRILFIIFICFLGNFSYSQIKKSSDTINFYSEYKSIMGKEGSSWVFETDPVSIKTIQALKLWDRSQLKFFLENRDKFKNIEAISFNTKIKNFDFLNEFPKLEHVSININKLNTTSLNSLVKNLNQNENIRLLDLGFKNKICLFNREFPKEFKNLKYIENLRIYNSRIKRFEIDFKIKNLIINYNKSTIKSIKANQVEYVILNFNELHQIPEGLNRSKNLKGLSISDYTGFKIDCPITGFENLIYFDAVGAKGLIVGRDCFENKDIKSIWGNMYEEYYLNEYKNGE